MNDIAHTMPVKYESKEDKEEDLLISLYSPTDNNNTNWALSTIECFPMDEEQYFIHLNVGGMSIKSMQKEEVFVDPTCFGRYFHTECLSASKRNVILNN